MVSFPPENFGFSRKPCNALLDEISVRVSPHQFETWFRNLPIHFHSPDKILITAPNRFSKTWIERKFREVIVASARTVFGFEPMVEIVVHPENPPNAGDEVAVAEEAEPVSGEQKKSLPRRRTGLFPIDEGSQRIAKIEPEAGSVCTDFLVSNPINRDFTFSNFVIGPSNRLAHAAALGVTEAPGRGYNPLFLYGGVGLGKTHLLHAIVHRLNESPGLLITYLTSESFMNQFLQAVEKGRTEEFRRKIRSTDVLIVDDIQFISKKDQTQEEFFHTFNALISGAKQVILSSDCSPKEIAGLKDRLISRFKMGLVTRIDPPCFDTRVAIVHRKSRARGKEISDEVANYIASHILNNIREIEGAIARLFSLASLQRSPDDPTGPPITIELARAALQEIVREENFHCAVSIADIEKAVSLFYDVKLSELISKRRNRTVSLARQVCMYLARQLTSCSLQEIGSFLGGRNHATVLYSINKVTENAKQDPKTAADLKLITNRITASRNAL